MQETIDHILKAQTFAVIGASTNPEKYGNIVYHDLKRHGKTVYPVHPHAASIDGDIAYPNVAALPETPEVAVAVVPPDVTEAVIDDLTAAGIRYLWMQPGAESATAIEKAERHGVQTVHSGPCIMVLLRTHRV